MQCRRRMLLLTFCLETLAPYVTIISFFLQRWEVGSQGPGESDADVSETVL